MKQVKLQDVLVRVVGLDLTDDSANGHLRPDPKLDGVSEQLRGVPVHVDDVYLDHRHRASRLRGVLGRVLGLDEYRVSVCLGR